MTVGRPPIDSGATGHYNAVVVLRRAALAVSLLLVFAALASAGWSDYLKKVKQGLGSSAESRSQRTKGSQAVLSVRGLNDGREKAASDTDRRNFRAIEKLDAIRVAPEELEKFVKEGKLDGR